MSSNFQALIKEIIQPSSIVPELDLFNVLIYNERLQYFFITYQPTMYTHYYVDC
jgi:hypothetical protein